jgi:pathogenesis-related protein 1
MTDKSHQPHSEPARRLDRRAAPPLRGGIAGQVRRFVRRAAWILLLAGTASAQSRTSANRTAAPSIGTLAQELLAAHNAVRAGLKLPPLQWSSRLAAFSQRWANTLLVKNMFAHNPESPYGENLFAIGGGAASASLVVNQWASESVYYNYRSNECSGVCGHYTQIVWRNTQRVGCAAARGVGREVWVCSYDPPGNYVGELPY